MRSYRAAVAAVLIVVLTASTAYACEKERHVASTHKKAETVSWDDVLLRGTTAADAGSESKPKAAAPGTKDLSAYQGLGSWVDIFNVGPWADPARAVRRMHDRGAKSIFLQTSTYGRRGGLYDRDAIDAYLHHAHKRGMKVVAWYVPAFDQQEVDFRRIRRAIRYRSPSGERFDSFGLDIEASNVGNIALRNRRLISLSKRMRRLAGPNYPLGAITPDPVKASYWPSFPYKQLAKLYDAFVPMGYFSFRARGFQDVHDYTAEGIRRIRRETQDPDVPIHFIGGIADDVKPHELKGFVKAARDHDIEGASLYDYPITSRGSWFQMRALSKDVAARRRAAASARKEAEAKRKQRERAKKRGKKADNTKSRNEGDDKAKKGSKKAKKGSKKGNGASSKGGKKVRNQRGAKKSGKPSKGRRNPSSSASRRGRPSLPEGERERQHLRAPDHRPLIS